jgi:RNA polymerase sigma factor (sigma-70 family)
MAASIGHVLSQIQRWASPRLSGLTDAVLLERFVQCRDESAFAELVARHGGMVLRTCRRILDTVPEIEDAFQATFLILTRKAHTLRQPEALPGYLHSISRRVALKARTTSAAGTGRKPLPDELADARSDPLARLTAREILTILDEEVARLPLAQRSAVVLCCMEGHTQEEAANMLGWTAGSLKGHLERGRRRLQSRLALRGIALSAGLALVSISRGEAASALLLRSTVTVALGGSSGNSAAALAHSVLQGMFISKLAGVLALVVTIVLAASATVTLALRGSVAQAPEEKLSSVPDAPRTAARRKSPVRTDVLGDPLPPQAVARLGSQRLYHGAVDVRQVILSPDSKLVTSTSDGGENKLWDVQTGRELPLPDHLRQAFLFTAKDKLLGVGQGNRLWDLATGKEVPAEGIDTAAARKRKEPGRREALSPDGTILAAWDDKGIRLLDARTRKELPPLQGQPKENVWPPCFSPDSKLLAVPSFLRPSGLPGVRLWDLATRKEARFLRGKDFQIFDITFSGDGKIVAAADGAGVTLWDATTGRWLHDLGHTYYVGAIAFTPDGKTLLTGSGYNDRFLRVWDPLSGRSLGKWKGHEWGILAISVTPDGRRAISTSQDATIRIWDLKSGEEMGRIGDGKSVAWAADLSRDGKLLATGGNGIQLWDFATRRKVRSFGQGTVLHLAFSPDGTKLASSNSKEATVRLWNVGNGEELRSFKGASEGGTKFGFSSDGRMLATGNSDGTIVIWDLLTGKQLRQLGQPLKPGPRSAYVLGDLTFSPDGRVVAAGYSDQSVRLLEVATGEERARYQGHRAGLDAVAFSPDGRLLASGGWDRTIMVWDVTGRVGAEKSDRIVLDAKLQERLWADLADRDAAKAYQAMQVLLGSEQTVSLLRKRMRPAVAADPARLNRLATDLDSDDFVVREKATQELTALGDRAESVLRKALPKASAEARRRIEDILVRIDPASSLDLLRGLRAVEVLEWLGTADAQQVLKILADGDPNARLTREAKAALLHLQAHRSRDRQGAGVGVPRVWKG